MWHALILLWAMYGRNKDLAIVLYIQGLMIMCAWYSVCIAGEYVTCENKDLLCLQRQLSPDLDEKYLIPGEFVYHILPLIFLKYVTKHHKAHYLHIILAYLLGRIWSMYNSKYKSMYTSNKDKIYNFNCSETLWNIGYLAEGILFIGLLIFNL